MIDEKEGQAKEERELLKILEDAEADVQSSRVYNMKCTFDDIRSILLQKKQRI